MSLPIIYRPGMINTGKEASLVYDKGYNLKSDIMLKKKERRRSKCKNCNALNSYPVSASVRSHWVHCRNCKEKYFISFRDEEVLYEIIDNKIKIRKDKEKNNEDNDNYCYRNYYNRNKQEKPAQFIMIN